MAVLVQTLLSKQPGTTAATHEEVVEWADAIVLAVTSPNDKAAIKEMAALVQGAVGKPVLDATNPLDTNYYCQLAGITSGAISFLGRLVLTDVRP